MKIYEGDDMMTMYFVIRRSRNNPNVKSIVAFSDNRALVESYVEFHNCKLFKIKSIHDKFDNICKILEENPHDEIGICNIPIRDPDKPDRSKLISIPITMTEQTLVNGEALCLMSSRVDYKALNASVDFFKDKYRKALYALHVKDAIEQAETGHNKFISNIEIDDLLVFYRSCPEDFG